MQAFQLTNEYNNVLLSWYFKGFELLRRYLTKHNPKVNLENLDFEAIDKEMEVDKASIAKDVASEGDTDEGVGDGQDNPTA